ncbi:response regulator [Spirosoma taeanense]|uniref:histidine kinase n=1 Tax=Spirosoma taeanense TaxID=2735870 RepID=A0A6M5Y7V1_9BACT|nr:two-component regulator propeller domain-containing protein [Spirosoma taeanense]QJW90417.1 response regulator [Spirosoma taeanense]
MLRFGSGFLILLILLTSGYLGRADVPPPEYLTVRKGLPQGYIKSMLQDQRGFIWLATRDGLCRYDGIRFKIFYHDPQNVRSLSFSSIYEIREDKLGQIWVRTENNNIDCFNPITEQSHRVSDSPAFRRIATRKLLTSIVPDQRGQAWVATQTNGFFRISANGTISHHRWAIRNDSVQHRISAILTDQKGFLWLATSDGLHRYNPASGEFTVFRTFAGLPHNDVRALHLRANGELMLGFPGQFALFNPTTGRTRRVIAVPGLSAESPLFAQDQQGNDYVNQAVYNDRTGLVLLPTDPKFAFYQPLSMLVDRSNVLWVGTNGDGVVKFDLNRNPFHSWPHRINFQTDWITQELGIPISAVPAPIRTQGPFQLRYQFDKQKNLWVGGRSIVPYQYNTAQRRFTPVQPVGIPARWLPGGVFRLPILTTGPEGEMWGLLGTDGRAVVRHNPKQHSFTVFPLPIPAGNPYEVMAMTVDGGRIYLATQSHGLLRADLSANRLIRWRMNPASPDALPVNSLLSLAQDPAQYNYLWIGTFGNGLCRLDKHTGQIRCFTVRNGLPNNVVYGIRPDADGHLWLSTNRGLCRFDSKSFDVRNYTTDDGLPSEEFNRFQDLALPNGRIVFGGIGGYTVFNPRRVNDDNFKPVVALTALRINNQPVSALDPESPIRQDINETREIVLNHEQNFLSFDFAALQYNQSDKNQYRHKLIGLDNDWVYTNNLATATYTNLPPATYTFVVNASNTSRIWSPHTHQIRVVIEPSPWATWWAYTLYGLLVLGAIITFVRIRINRIRLQSHIELQEKESIQLRNLDEVKSRFFANITHEFRTPLTLILTPLEQLLNEINDPQHHSRLSMVYRNASQLLRLINELLDLAKLEAGSLTVTPAQGDLVEFVERTTLVFEEEAERKQIQLRLQPQVTHRFYWFDADKLEKILNNLLANALKFTGENGKIDVTLSVRSIPETPAPTEAEQPADSIIRLIVSDTGTGIADHKLPYIFNRFYQADQTASRSLVGSGIGLALVKELVDVMQGTIRAESRPGAGSTFTVELPCRSARAGGETPVQPLPTPQREPVTSPESTNSADLPYILLVEDNDELAEFITDILSVEWHVRRVHNGRLGVDTATSEGPDLVISDVLMPEMNGFELCRQLKSSPVTNHIPVLLLTAKAGSDSRVEGLTAGADDYLTKPFQVDELRWRVRNRLEQQRRFRQHFRMQLLSEGHLPTQSEVAEDEFMNRLYDVIKARLGDTNFGVEPLAASVNLSRMQLNRKVKAMTGLTPVELIRAVRLNRAADMLLTNVSISDVAFAVGMDPAYFSKVFKDQHGLTPSEYVEQNRRRSA